MIFFRIGLSLCLSLFSVTAVAQAFSIGGIEVGLSADASSNEEIASAFQILALLTVLSLAPAMLIVLTSFTRIVIVLAMLRHAFGMPTTPPNTVIIALSLFLTLFTMMPVLEKVDASALGPYRNGQLTSVEAVKVGMEPVRVFMISQTREKDLVLISELSGKAIPDSVAELPTSTLIPAFMISELQSAFQIGFVLFLPFLAIDLITASVLMAMGMIMVPPLTISLPLKILMFALIDGWALVVEALVGSFA